MRILVIWFGKLSIAILKLFGKNGSALPGLIVEKVYPNFLEKQLKQLEDGIVIVTGTNGKTTTTKALVYLLEQSDRSVLTNPTGSNFTRGIYSTLLKHSNLTGVLDYDIGVLELDEAFSRKLAARVPPKAVLALNVMRDQLDRYGEIDTTAEMIGETISYATDSVILNSDDNRVASLKQYAKAKVSYFGVNKDLKHLLPSDDELHGKKNKHKKHHKVNVLLNEYKNGNASWLINSKIFRSKLQVPGLHNAVNITAAIATTLEVAPEMKPQFIIPTVANISSAFGRGEIVEVGEKSITLVLVKNPSGLRQSLKSYQNEDFDLVMFAINDKYADGRDVSWLWDVSYEEVKDNKSIITSGIRADDMTLRLKYDDIDNELSDSNIANAVDVMITTTEKHAIAYCTYTAMLEIRKNLAKVTKVEGIW